MLVLSSLLALKLLTLSASGRVNPPSPGTAGGIKLPGNLHAPADTVEAAAARAKRANAIRAVDLRGLLASPLGMVAQSGVLYADLTDDGKEEVIVPLTAGNAGGLVAVAVFGYDAHGALTQLLWREGTRLEVAVRSGHLEIGEPARAPGDELCCPSGALQTTRYQWDGHALVAQAAAPK